MADSSKPGKKDDRVARRAAALRRNLARRKAQARERDKQPVDGAANARHRPSDPAEDDG